MSKTFFMSMVCGALMLASCGKKPVEDPKAALWTKIDGQVWRQDGKHRLFEGKPLSSRLAEPPGAFLDLLRTSDERYDYAARPVTAAEQKIFADAVKRLPKAWIPILEKHLLAVYAVENYWGGGFTEFMPKRDGSVACYMVVNLASFQRDISTWMTLKEESAWTRGEKGYRLAVDAGTRMTGLDYVLIHESAHVVDYATAATPWVEPDVKTLFGRGDEPTVFTKGVWSNDKVALAEVEFENRGKAVAYGFKGAPKLSLDAAPGFFRNLARSPFVSAYASQSWAEDWADTCTFRILERELGRPVTVTVKDGDQPVYSYAPTAGAAVRARVTPGLD